MRGIPTTALLVCAAVIVCGFLRHVSGLACFVSRPGTVERAVECPHTARGCTKLVLHLNNGYAQVEKLCGAPERFDFNYREGCDTISVPFKQTQCYCRGHLCNAAADKRLGRVTAVVVPVILSIVIIAFG